MRISDWSSDVCSSDLLPDILDPVRVAADQVGDDGVGQVGRDRQLAAVQGRVADAVEAVVGRDLEGDEVAAGAGDDDAGADDLHGRFSAVRSVGSASSNSSG